MNKLINAKNGVHDPTIIQVEDKYYLVSTDTQQPLTQGVPIRSSNDLINWTFEKTALNGVPEGANTWSSAEGLWAPEIIYVNKEYRMYYSASTFGSTTSMIGLACSDHPLGEWHDRGEVIKTNAEIADHNAIDANICYDEEGHSWMVYGSFFGGIYLVQLDHETGKCLRENDYGKCLALRPQSVEGAIEGPYIIYNKKSNYYYLFVSFDSLNDSYNIRVARSRKIDGPYIDRNGRSMLDIQSDPTEIGTKLLGSYQWIDENPLYGPGHNSIFTDKKNQQEFMVHHIRRTPSTADFFMQIRSLFWLEDGWPVVGATEFDGSVQRIDDKSEQISGQWQIILFNNQSEVVKAKRMVIENGKLYDEICKEVSDLQRNMIFYETSQGETCLTGRTLNGAAIIGRKMSQ